MLSRVRQSWLLPAFILLGAVFVATYHLTESPGVWYDEGFFIQAAGNLAERGAQVMQLAPGDDLSSWSISAGYPFLLPLAASFKFFGLGLFQARVVMAAFLVLFLVAAYVLARRMFSLAISVCVLALLASLPLLYGTGKAVLGEVPALFYLILTLLALLSLERREYKKYADFILVGVLAGLTFATKYIFVLVLPALLVALFIKRTRIFAGLGWRGLGAAAAAFAVPFLVWIHFQFGLQDSLGSIVSFFSNPYENDSAEAFTIIFNNLLRFVTELTPLYMLGVFVPWLVSLALRARDTRERVLLPEYGAFIFSLLVLGAYLWSPGWYKYFFPALCVSLIFFPYAVQYLYRFLGRYIPQTQRVAWLPFFLFGALALFQSYQLAFHSYVADYYRSARAAALTAYVSTIDANEKVFLYNVPEVAAFLPVNGYTQYITPHPSQQFGAKYLAGIDNGTFDIVIVNTENYIQDPSRFGRYEAVEKVAHYTILRRP